MDVHAGIELAERISGDTAVGHGLAYCLAVEEACGIEVPARASELRAVLLELERLYNHVADIGALCNDVGFGLAQAKALTLAGAIAPPQCLGHRSPTAPRRCGPGRSTGRLSPRPRASWPRSASNSRSWWTWPSARASSWIASRAPPCSAGATSTRSVSSVWSPEPRGRHSTPVSPIPSASRSRGSLLRAPTTGDVLARFQVRVDEVAASLALIADYGGRSRTRSSPSVRSGSVAGSGSGIVEGWRGAIVAPGRGERNRVA